MHTRSLPLSAVCKAREPPCARDGLGQGQAQANVSRPCTRIIQAGEGAQRFGMALGLDAGAVIANIDPHPVGAALKRYPRPRAVKDRAVCIWVSRVRSSVTPLIAAWLGGLDVILLFAVGFPGT